MASNNIINFLIRLRGDAANAITAARQVDRSLAGVERRAAAVGGALKRAFSLSNFNAALMSVPGMQFLTNPYTMAAAAVGAVAKVGMEAENTAVAFRTLLGSQEASKKMLDSIAALDAKKVYGLDTVQEAAKQMLNFGVESEKVLSYLGQLGDIAGGDRQKLASLGLVFGQVTAAGKLSGQDLLQFINAGFNPLKELEALTGKTYGELQDLMGKGAISADMVAAAMARATGEGGKFFGMTASLGQSTSAKLQDVMSQITEGALKIYEQLSPLILDVISLFQKIVPPVMTVVQFVVGAVLKVVTWIKAWKSELGLLAVVVGTFFAMVQAKTIILFGLVKVLTFVKTAITTLTVVWRYLKIALTTNPIGIIIALIGALAAAVIYCWNEFAGFRAFLTTAWDTLKEFGTILKDLVVDRIKELIGGIGDLGVALQRLFSGDFEGAWEAAKSGARKMSGVDSFRKAAESSVGAYKNIQGNWQKNLLAEQAKEQDKKGSEGSAIATPGLVGSGLTNLLGGGNGKPGKGARKIASEVATGGQRNTSITMNIGKFFDSINVYMADATDTNELERTVVEALNRALAVATSADR